MAWRFGCTEVSLFTVVEKRREEKKRDPSLNNVLRTAEHSTLLSVNYEQF